MSAFLLQNLGNKKTMQKMFTNSSSERVSHEFHAILDIEPEKLEELTDDSDSISDCKLKKNDKVTNLRESKHYESSEKVVPTKINLLENQKVDEYLEQKSLLCEENSRKCHTEQITSRHFLSKVWKEEPMSIAARKVDFPRLFYLNMLAGGWSLKTEDLIHLANKIENGQARVRNANETQRKMITYFTDVKGQNLIHVAASQGLSKCLQILLKSKSNIVINKPRDIDGRTPLHCAFIGNNYNCLRLLIDAGADVNARDYEENSLLCYALSSKFTSESNVFNDMTINIIEKPVDSEMSQILNKTEVDLSFKETNLHIHEEQQKTEDVMKIDAEKVNKLISLLIEKGAQINFKNKNGQSPLHVAVMQGNSELIKMLIENGAKINVT